MAGLFSTFNTATSGLSSQQKAIDVTSHNISNANTEGYSRQRAIMESKSPYDSPSINSAAGAQVGTGTDVTDIQRIRDTFLDYQIRVETSTKGTYETKNNYLSEVESILNDTSGTGISSLIGKFFDSWQELAKQPASSDTRTVVAQQSNALADELNHSYTQLQNLKSDTQSSLKDQVFQANDIINQIDKLNQQIIDVKVGNNEPNDLMDKRDLLIDKLSEQFNINIDKESYDGLSLKPGNTNGISYPNLVQSQNPDQEKRFSYVSSIDSVNDPTTNTYDASAPANTYKVTYYKNGDMTNENNRVDVYVTMDSTEFQQLDENRVLWASKDGSAIGVSVDEAGTPIISSDVSPLDFTKLKLFTPDHGQMKGAMSVQSDIDNYTDQLNKIAKALAFTVNAVHSGMTNATSSGTASDGTPTPSEDDMPFFVNSNNINYTKDANGMDILSTTDGPPSSLNKVLTNESGITAGNISVNKEIMDDVMKIKTRTNDDKFANESDNNVDGNSDGNRALAIAQLRDKITNIQKIDASTKRSDFFDTTKIGTGWAVDSNGVNTIQNSSNGMTVDNYYKDTIDKLGVQEQQAKRVVQNQTSLLQSFEQSRASVSGVSIDEEMSNLIQFQHAYQANAKVISTVSDLLDVVIGLIK